MRYEIEIKHLEKKINQLNEQLVNLKESLKNKYPEDFYGVTWMNKFDSKSVKLSNQIKNLKNQLNVAYQYRDHFLKGSTNDN